jgi:hypothetical protein
MKKKGLLIAILLLIAVPTVAAQDLFEDIFSVFEGVDIPDLYAQNRFLFEFFLYTILFVSIARLTIGQRFEGRAAKTLSGVVGLMLAFGLAMWTSSRDYSLASFGPFAAIVLLSFLGFVLFMVIKSLGAEALFAGSIGWIISYLTLIFVFPQLNDWIREITILRFGLAAVTLVSIVIVATGLWRRGRGVFEGMGGVITPGERLRNLGKGLDEFKGRRQEAKADRKRDRLLKRLMKREDQLYDSVIDSSEEELKKLKNIGGLLRELYEIRREIESVKRG